MSTTNAPHMTALDAIHARRATRAFTSAPVDEASIHKLLSAAVRAPTAMHAEPWSFVVVQNRGFLRRLSDRAKTLAAQPVAHAPSHDLVRAASPSSAAARLVDPAFNIFYDAGTLIVICSQANGAFAAADCWSPPRT